MSESMTESMEDPDRQKWRKLYYDAWDLVRVTFFDASRLKDWHKLANAFDSEIVDKDSALAAIDKMLATLGDRYTERVIAPVASTNGSRTEAEKPKDAVARVLEGNIGYLRIRSFDREEIADLVEEEAKKLADCRGIVLDIRQNSGGRMHQAMDCCSIFLAEALLCTLKFRAGDALTTWQYFINCDQFFAEVTERDAEDNVLNTHIESYVRRVPILAGKPIVILINGRTASAGELTICSLVQYGEVGKVLMVGSGRTPGKGIGQGEYDVDETGEVRLRITRIHWFAPGGEWLGDCGQTTRNGIEPDVIVENDTGPEGRQAAFAELGKMLDQLEASQRETVQEFPASQVPVV